MQALIPIDRIKPNSWQTRIGDPDPEYISSLGEDIAQNTMLQYPAGRLIENGRLYTFSGPIKDFEIVATLEEYPEVYVQLAFGHNRWLAYQYNYTKRGEEWAIMPVDIRPLTDEQMAIMAWSENEKRRDHTPYERAQAIQKRMDDFNWTQAQVADHLGMSRPAVSNALRLLKLPAEILEALAGGKLSERAGMALVSLFDLPEALRQTAESEYGMRPSGIVRSALNGEYSSDQIRSGIERICSDHGRNLKNVSWSLDDFFPPDQVVSVTCRDCESRLKERNLCLDLKCFAVKERVTRQTYLEKASQACGFPPLEEEKYAYGSTTDFVYSRNHHFPAILQAGCENLRVMFDRNVRVGKTADEPGYVSGFPNAKIVCNKREQFCTCLKGLDALEAQRKVVQPTATLDRLPVEATVEIPAIETPTEAAEAAPDANDLKEAAKAVRAEKRQATQEAKAIIQDVAERIATGLVMKNSATWRKVAEAVHYSLGGKNVWEIQAAIGKHLAEGAMPYEIKRLEDVTVRMDKLLKQCGLEPLTVPAAQVDPSNSLPDETVFENPEGKPLVKLWAEDAKDERKE